jgi:hypothetical protein
VKNHCKLFSCFVFVQTYIFVSHGPYLSLFNVLKQKWIDHMNFNFATGGKKGEKKSEIIQVFRSELDDGSFDICVLTSDNKIYLVSKTNQKYPDGTIGRYEVMNEFPIEGKFLQHD